MSVNIQERFMQMSLGERIILIAAPLFFIFGFFPWFDYDFAGGPSRNAWSGDFSFLSMIAVLCAIVMAAQIIITRFTTVALPALPQGVTWARVHLGLAVYIAFAVLVRLLLGESAGSGDFSVDADMAFGLWLAAITAAALVVGAGLLFQAERGGGGGGSTSSM